jgi:3-dehydroquinate synthetase
MRADKKKDGQDIQIVLLKDMGEPFVCRLDLEQFLKKVEEYDEFKS